MASTLTIPPEPVEQTSSCESIQVALPLPLGPRLKVKRWPRRGAEEAIDETEMVPGPTQGGDVSLGFASPTTCSTAL